MPTAGHVGPAGRTVAVALIVAALLVSPVSAAPAAPPRFRVGAHGGYRVGGDLHNVRYDPVERPVDLELDEGFAFGAHLGYAIRRNILVTLRFDRQDTDLRAISGPEEAGFPVTSDHLHLGFDFLFPQRALTPLLSFSLGSTFLRPEGGRDTLDRFSWSMGVGAERAVASRVWIRAETRLLAVFLDSNRSAFCGSGDDCYNYALSTWLWQGEGTLGFVVGF